MRCQYHVIIPCHRLLEGGVWFFCADKKNISYGQMLKNSGGTLRREKGYSLNDQGIIAGQLTLAGLLLVLITVWLNHLLANTRDAKNKRTTHAVKLIEAFQPELDAIIQTSEDCRLIMTDEVYNKHESAIRAFTHHLSCIDKFRLNRLWNRLAMIEVSEKHHIAFYAQYADCGSLNKRRRIRPIVAKRIQDIISFANK